MAVETRIVLDANILIRAVLGQKVRNILTEYAFSAQNIDDWPIVAVSLMLDCPIWTEDTDFFGAGVATWTSDRIHLFLS